MNRPLLLLPALTLLIVDSCSSPNSSQTQLRTTVKLLAQATGQMTVGRAFEPTPGLTPSRVKRIRWDGDELEWRLLHQMARPTYTDIAVRFEPQLKTTNSMRRIVDLEHSRQDALRNEWKRRIVLALGDSTFESAPAAVAHALDKDGLIVHYFLVNRHSSPQMGRVDIVKIIITSPDGVIVARTKPEFSLDYPLHFVDQTQWNEPFLF